MRDITFAQGEHYHIWNRGVDKRIIFNERSDLDRFMLGLEQLNTPEVVGALVRKHRVFTRGGGGGNGERLVEIVAYCLNPNHFHLILEQVADRGIEKFMHKLGMGYSKYFNTKYGRTGALFSGKFKAKHIDSNEYLLHLSAYINLNNLVHGNGRPVSTLVKTSWDEYLGNVSSSLCKKENVLGQFKTSDSYKKFAKDSLKEIVRHKILLEALDV